MNFGNFYREDGENGGEVTRYAITVGAQKREILSFLTLIRLPVQQIGILNPLIRQLSLQQNSKWNRLHTPRHRSPLLQFPEQTETDSRFPLGDPDGSQLQLPHKIDRNRSGRSTNACSSSPDIDRNPNLDQANHCFYRRILLLPPYRRRSMRFPKRE